jgi:hypothetical protein
MRAQTARVLHALETHVRLTRKIAAAAARCGTSDQRKLDAPSLSQRLWHLTDNLRCLLVGAQTYEYWMAHLTGRSPFAEPYLGNELGRYPGSPAEIRNLLGDRLFVRDQRNKLLVYRAQRLSVEAGAGAAHIFPAFSIAHSE